MKPALHNYRRRRSWRGVLPILPACLVPLAMMGVTVKPVVDFGGLATRLDEARTRAAEAREMRDFLAEFGDEGPPIEQFLGMQRALEGRLPHAFRSTELYEAALSAAKGLELDLETIVPGSQQDLGHPVGGRSVHECRAILKGRGRAEALPAFLVALHGEGHPVSVHGCKLHALEGRPGVYDFHLDLGVYFLALPAPDDAEPTEDS